MTPEELMSQLRDANAELTRCGERCRELLSENEALTTRRDELLELVARLSRTAPYEDETRYLRSQVGTLLAEVGTLRSANQQLEARARDMGTRLRLYRSAAKDLAGVEARADGACPKCGGWCDVRWCDRD